MGILITSAADSIRVLLSEIFIGCYLVLIYNILLRSGGGYFTYQKEW